jgi:hypothetical protein
LTRYPRGGSHGGIGGGNGGDDVWGGWNGGGWNGGNGDGEGEVAMSGGLGLLWDKYNEVLETNPLPTKAVTSLVGFTIGDLLAQSFLGEKGAPIDVKRLLRCVPNWDGDGVG